VTAEPHHESIRLACDKFVTLIDQSAAESTINEARSKLERAIHDTLARTSVELQRARMRMKAANFAHAIASERNTRALDAATACRAALLDLEGKHAPIFASRTKTACSVKITKMEQDVLRKVANAKSHLDDIFAHVSKMKAVRLIYLFLSYHPSNQMNRMSLIKLRIWSLMTMKKKEKRTRKIRS
jgi:hypothetical protein